MSRGLGKRQRQLLDSLREAVGDDGWPEWVSSTELARSIRSNGPPSRSEKVHVQEVLRKLEPWGAVEVSGERELKARLPLTPRQRQLERRSKMRRARKELERLGWREVLWEWYEHSEAGLPDPDSTYGRRLVRAGLPPEMLDDEWWEERYRSETTGSGYHRQDRSWYDLSDVPAHLRFEPKETEARQPTRREERESRREERERRRRAGLVKRPAHERSHREIDEAIKTGLAQGRLQPRNDPTVRRRYIRPKPQ